MHFVYIITMFVSARFGLKCLINAIKIRLNVEVDGRSELALGRTGGTLALLAAAVSGLLAQFMHCWNK